MRFIIFFLMLSIHVSAQDLKYIPDVNLRNALTEQGFTTNDSLDLDKIRGRLILELNGKGIVNLEGLQYFERVWLLSLLNNEIESLDYLPPNLKTLGCHNNNIKEIKNLPKTIENLSCSYNQINLIENLPSSLKRLDFRGNKMNYLPKLPANIEFINYAANPIPSDSLPPEYQNFTCDRSDVGENCLPYKFVKWNILNSNMVRLSQDLKRMTIEVQMYRQIETFDFIKEGSNFVADKVKVTKRHRDSTGATYIHNKYSVSIDKVQDILNDIYAEKMSFTIPRQDDTIKIDMSKKRMFCPGCGCWYSSHDVGYSFHYTFYTDTDTFQLKHGFSGSRSRNGLKPCEHTTHRNIKRAFNWFYMYRLANLTLKNHELTKRYFNNENLERSVKVVEKEY